MDYSKLAKTYEKLEKRSSRLKKIEILACFLKGLKKEKNKEIVYLLQGRVYPDYNKTELGVSNKLMKKVLKKATGASSEKITKLWKEKGDLGTVAEKLVEEKSQKTLSKKKLTAEKVLENLKRLTEFEGKGTIEKKLSLIAELLTSASSLEARYIVRTILHDLRIGVGSSTLRDAVVKACFKNKENKKLVQQAYDKTTDFSLVFKKSCEGKKALEKVELSPGKPVKVMLFQKEDSIKKGFERVGKPCLIEYKYDGFRMLITKSKQGIRIFTRRLEDVTKQFPEVEEYVKKYVKGKNFILDSEAVGYNQKKQYRPFQEISQRIKRKYDIEKLKKKLPVEINVFDILYHNNKSYLNKPLKKRRKKIEKIIKSKKWKIRPSKALKTKSVKKAQKFYEQALKQGEEGIMMKNLEAEYKPGSRVGYGIKIKPEENEMDLVITGADYGTGKRAGWLTSFYVSCKGKNKLLEVGKVSTGLKEKKSEGLSYKQMTKKLKKIEKKTKGIHIDVEPKIVVMVVYQNIQKSPKYSSGFALRFPRFKKLRPDKNIDEIATINEVKKEYKK